MFPIFTEKDGSTYIDPIGIVEATILIAIVAFIIYGTIGYFIRR